MWRDEVKAQGAENDQAYQRIMEWFEQNPNRRVNSTELSLMGFKRWKKGQRVWVSFSPSCIERKARDLAIWGVLERGYDTSHHAWYSFKGEEKPKELMHWEVVEENGIRKMKLMPV